MVDGDPGVWVLGFHGGSVAGGNDEDAPPSTARGGRVGRWSWGVVLIGVLLECVARPSVGEVLELIMWAIAALAVGVAVGAP